VNVFTIVMNIAIYLASAVVFAPENICLTTICGQVSLLQPFELPCTCHSPLFTIFLCVSVLIWYFIYCCSIFIHNCVCAFTFMANGRVCSRSEF